MHYVMEEENNATLRTPVLLSRGAKKFYGHTGLCSGVRIGNSTITPSHKQEIEETRRKIY